MSPEPTFDERLVAPVSYWLVSLFFGLTFVTAVGFYLGPELAVGAAVALAAAIAAALGWFGRTRIHVDEAGLRVGESLLEWPYLGVVSRLDAEATRRRLGVDADARAFVTGRPYVPTAVEVEVVDVADPHPYWLVASRHPAELAVALERGKAEWGRP